MDIKIYGIEVINNKPQVCSRVIAEQLQKRHKDVLRKIREVLTEREYSPREFSYGNNNKATEYLLDKDSFILLVMNYEGYNDFKRAYIKQFNAMELELQNAPQIPKSYPAALKLAYEQALQIEQQQEQLQLQAPKIVYHDDVLNTDNAFTTQQIAEELNMTAQALNKALNKKGIQYKQSGQYLLYVKYKGHGYSKTRTKIFKRTNGDNETTHYTVWTEKGRKFIHQIIAEDNYSLEGLNG